MWFKWFMLAVFVILTAYALWRSIHCFNKMQDGKGHKLLYIAYAVAFIACCSTILLGGLLPYGPTRIALHKFGNYWLGFFIYLLMFIMLADILVLVLRRINRKKPVKILGTTKGARLIGIAVLVLSVGFTAYGLIHVNNIFTNLYDIDVEKDAGDMEELNIVLIADLHLGYSVDSTNMKQMVDKVNACNPDIIFVAGDIVDNEYEALDNPDNLAKILSGMKSKYGTYAVYGNHDVAETLIGGFSITPKSEAFRDPRVADFLEKSGFIMLEDSSVLVDDKFYVVGRLDGEKAGDGTTNRLGTEELLEGLDIEKPVIMLSHEPDELEENAEAGIDIQLSGHTHAGQFFPITLTAPIVWENYWGYLKVGNMHSLVTSGVGIYGPDMRVMTDSEIMKITVHFKK